MKRLLSLCLSLTALVAVTSPSLAFSITGTAGTRIEASPVAQFEEPWAMTFLPGGEMLVTEKPGRLLLVTRDGGKVPVQGLWPVAYGGQGGLGDVVAHPDYADNGFIYLSYAEAGDGGQGAVVARARLDRSGAQPVLRDAVKIWEQQPKTSGRGHYSHKIAFGPDGMLYITSGDRQKQTPAQDMSVNLGKLIRLNPDGSVPADNPFQNEGELARTFWTVGHRNLLGIDFASDGTLWTHEMGPRHGDELNRIEAGTNYGWPVVSNGDNYSGVPIPDHDTRPDFNAPEAFWVPSIAPSGLVIYDGDQFGGWRGDALIGALAGQALIHVDIEGTAASEAERFEWGSRVREVEQGPDGAVWVLEDGDGGRLLRLLPG